jgi:hypothetical protein
MKPRPLTLRPHEARRLAECGEVLIVRPVEWPKLPTWCDSSRDYNVLVGGLPYQRRYDVSGLALEALVACPFGSVGDVLWGREAYYDRGDYAAIGRLHEERYVYAADGKKDGWLLHQAVHMPRTASRFPRLAVAKVECRRMRSVTEEEAIQAGVECNTDDGVRYFGPQDRGDCRFEVEFAKLHGPTAWADDAFCWFVAMRKEEG